MRKYSARKSNYILSPSIDGIDGTIKRDKFFKFFFEKLHLCIKNLDLTVVKVTG
jgi:hypothetical protein